MMKIIVNMKECFSKKVNSKIDSEIGDKEQIFVVNEEDVVSFAPDDIVLILPAPVSVNGPERTSRPTHVRFNFDFSKLDEA